jgi:hypothetical protein
VEAVGQSDRRSLREPALTPDTDHHTPRRAGVRPGYYYSRTFTLCDGQGDAEAQSMGGIFDLAPTSAVVKDR